MFLLIFGLRDYAHRMATVRLACRNGHVAAHGLFKVVRRFSLFFVPLFPVKTTYLTSCSQCGLRLAWSAEEAQTMAERHGVGTTADADPVHPPLGAAFEPAPSLPAPVAPAGWYPDPEGGPRRRWWDGVGWSDHREDAGSDPTGKF
jgi:Protein of unknown function (DUF2510)